MHGIDHKHGSQASTSFTTQVAETKSGAPAQATARAAWVSGLPPQEGKSLTDRQVALVGRLLAAAGPPGEGDPQRKPAVFERLLAQVLPPAQAGGLSETAHHLAMAMLALALEQNWPADRVRWMTHQLCARLGGPAMTPDSVQAMMQAWLAWAGYEGEEPPTADTRPQDAMLQQLCFCLRMPPGTPFVPNLTARAAWRDAPALPTGQLSALGRMVLAHAAGQPDEQPADLVMDRWLRALSGGGQRQGLAQLVAFAELLAEAGSGGRDGLFACLAGPYLRNLSHLVFCGEDGRVPKGQGRALACQPALRPVLARLQALKDPLARQAVFDDLVRGFGRNATGFAQLVQVLQAQARQGPGARESKDAKGADGATGEAALAFEGEALLRLVIAAWQQGRDVQAWTSTSGVLAFARTLAATLDGLEVGWAVLPPKDLPQPMVHAMVRALESVRPAPESDTLAAVEQDMALVPVDHPLRRALYAARVESCLGRLLEFEDQARIAAVIRDLVEWEGLLHGTPPQDDGTRQARAQFIEAVGEGVRALAQARLDDAAALALAWVADLLCGPADAPLTARAATWEQLLAILPALSPSDVREVAHALEFHLRHLVTGSPPRASRAGVRRILGAQVLQALQAMSKAQREALCDGSAPLGPVGTTKESVLLSALSLMRAYTPVSHDVALAFAAAASCRLALSDTAFAPRAIDPPLFRAAMALGRFMGRNGSSYEDFEAVDFSGLDAQQVMRLMRDLGVFRPQVGTDISRAPRDAFAQLEANRTLAPAVRQAVMVEIAEAFVAHQLPKLQAGRGSLEFLMGCIDERQSLVGVQILSDAMRAALAQRRWTIPWAIQCLPETLPTSAQALVASGVAALDSITSESRFQPARTGALLENYLHWLRVRLADLGGSQAQFAEQVLEPLSLSLLNHLPRMYRGNADDCRVFGRGVKEGSATVYRRSPGQDDNLALVADAMERSLAKCSDPDAHAPMLQAVRECVMGLVGDNTEKHLTESTGRGASSPWMRMFLFGRQPAGLALLDASGLPPWMVADQVRWLCARLPAPLAPEHLPATMAAIARNPSFPGSLVQGAQDAVATEHAKAVLSQLAQSGKAADPAALEARITALRDQEAAQEMPPKTVELLVEALVDHYIQQQAVRLSPAGLRALRDLYLRIAQGQPSVVETKAQAVPARPRMAPVAALSLFYSQLLDVPVIREMASQGRLGAMKAEEFQNLWQWVCAELAGKDAPALEPEGGGLRSGDVPNVVAARLLAPLHHAMEEIVSFQARRDGNLGRLRDPQDSPVEPAGS